MSKSGERTSLGLDQNLAGLLCYVLGWVTGVIFLILEKNKFVRFHAIQSIVTFGAITIISIPLWLLGWIPWVGILFLIISWFLWVFPFILWIGRLLNAYQGKKYKLPVAGNIA